jgi:hypothetical protein
VSTWCEIAQKFRFCIVRDMRCLIRDTSVSMVIRLWAMRPGFDFWQQKRFFSSPARPDWLWGLPSLLFNGYRGYLLGDKAAEAWSWPHTPHGLCLIKQTNMFSWRNVQLSTGTTLSFTFTLESEAQFLVLEISCIFLHCDCNGISSFTNAQNLNTFCSYTYTPDWKNVYNKEFKNSVLN